MVLPRYPQEDDELRAMHSYRTPGGNACNTARILAKLGHKVRLISTLGNDASAQWLKNQLQLEKVDTELCPALSGQTTPFSSIWLNQQNGSRTISHYRELAELSSEDLTPLYDLSVDWIHFEGRNIETLSRFIKSSEVHKRVNLSLELEKVRPNIEQLLPWMNTVIVSSHYLRENKQAPAACMDSLKQINSELNIVCTLGADGLIAMDNSGQVIQIAAQTVPQVVDSIGAGDCFIAGYISQILQTRNFEQSLNYANHLAALKIQHQGINFNV
jgi:ketohexokinase